MSAQAGKLRFLSSTSLQLTPTHKQQSRLQRQSVLVLSPTEICRAARWITDHMDDFCTSILRQRGDCSIPAQSGGVGGCENRLRLAGRRDCSMEFAFDAPDFPF